MYFIEEAQWMLFEPKKGHLRFAISLMVSPKPTIRILSHAVTAIQGTKIFSVTGFLLSDSSPALCVLFPSPGLGNLSSGE